MIKNETLKKAIPFAEVISKIIAFVIILFMMKVLPISEYADYSYIVSIVLWAAFMMDGGINNLVFNKSLKNDLNEINTLFSSRFLLSVLVIIGLSLFFILRKPEIAFSAIIFSIVLYFNTSTTFIKMLSRGREYPKVDLFTVLSEPILRLSLFLIVYFTFPNFNWNLWKFMLIYLIAGIISFLINYSVLYEYFRLQIKIISYKKMFNQVKNTLNISKYFLFAGLLHTINSRLEIIYLEKFTSKINLALFSSALTLTEVILLFFFAITTSHFMRIYKSSKIAFLYVFLATILIAIITQFSSKYIFNIFFPAEYEQSAFILNHLIFAILPSVIVFYFITKLNYENKAHINFKILLIPIILKIIIYSYKQSSELNFYEFLYPIIEYLILICYFIYFTINKKKGKLKIKVKEELEISSIRSEIV